MIGKDGRRTFLTSAAGLVLVTGAARGAVAAKAGKERDEVAPPEDLMREHGVLNRILLLYEESIRRLEARHPLPPEALAGAADLIRRFIEQYHEKLEEDHLFPRFEKAGRLVDLVATLRSQHLAGRRATETILSLANAKSFGTPGDVRTLVETLRAFIRMYRPHEAREDTVLFPAVRTIVTPKAFAALGEQFEDEEHVRFGKDGFEGIVAQVARLEQSLGIYELAQFTPA
jgi:hemerythrin-like domain-containing protein